MTTPRELTVLQVVADLSPRRATPRWIGWELGITQGRAREVARYLVGRGLLHQGRGSGRNVDYVITDAGRRELDGNGRN
jgi:hypothetical protein